MKRYRVYKASIDTYRVWDTLLGGFKIREVHALTIFDPVFKVNQAKYELAKVRGFANSGDPRDYFAWIECDSFEVGILYPYQFIQNVVKFNPFRADYFFREDEEMTKVDRATACIIYGNRLLTN